MLEERGIRVCVKTFLDALGTHCIPIPCRCEALECGSKLPHSKASRARWLAPRFIGAAFLDRAQGPWTYKTGPRYSLSNHPSNCQAARGSAHVC